MKTSYPTIIKSPTINANTNNTPFNANVIKFLTSTTGNIVRRSNATLGGLNPALRCLKRLKHQAGMAVVFPLYLKSNNLPKIKF